MLRPLIVALSIAAAASPAIAQPHLQDAWVRLSAVTGRPAAGFFTAHGTKKPDAVISITTPKAERVEMHSVSLENGVMRMRPEKSMAIPAYRETKLAPGGSHLMLFGVSPDVKPGSNIPLTFRFQSGETSTVNATVKAANDPAAQTTPAHQH